MEPSAPFHSRIWHRRSSQARSLSLITLILWVRCDVDLGSRLNVVNLWLWLITYEHVVYQVWTMTFGLVEDL
jgi:hypothetical protein